MTTTLSQPTKLIPVDLDDQDATNQLGRCIYCDERCNVDSNYHDYCRQAYALEEQQMAQLRKRARHDEPEQRE